jgi:hypothetical protein
MVRSLGWVVLALGGGWIVWHFARHRFAVGGVGLAVSVLGALLGALAGRKFEIAERIDHELEDLFGNIEVDDVSTWVPTVAGAAVFLGAYLLLQARSGGHEGTETRAHERTTKDESR